MKTFDDIKQDMKREKNERFKNTTSTTHDCMIQECETIKQRKLSSFEPNFQVFIKDISKKYLCPYTIQDSKTQSQLYFRFKCKFAGKNKYSTNCQSFIYFKGKNDVISFSNANWNHNHSLDPYFIKSKVNTLTSIQKKEIKSLRNDGHSAGFCRRKLDLSILPNFLYESSRKVLSEKFENQIQNFIEHSIQYQDLFLIKNFWTENLFQGSVFISKRFINSPFSNDIILVDDTCCTNKFNFPIIVAVGIDENRISQLIAFGLINGKKTDDFDLFFNELAQHFSIRVFVCDRLKSQTKSIRNSQIVYCKLHIRRNILTHFNTTVLNSYDRLMNGEICKNDFLQVLDSISPKTIEGIMHLKYLKKDIDCYAPESLKNLILRDIRTTNSVESLFGRFKTLTDHQIILRIMYLLFL